MGDYTARFSELHYPLDYEHADSLAVGTHLGGANGPWILIEDYHRLAVVIDLGDMTAGASFDFDVRQATSTLGAGDKAITGKAITQLLQADGDGNDLMCIEIQSEELDVTGGFCYVECRCIVGGAACEAFWVLLGIEPRFMPTATTNWTEIVG